MQIQYNQVRRSSCHWPWGGLICVILTVLSIANLQFQVGLFPFPSVQFLRLWQLMSWLKSGHHVVSSFHLAGVSVSAKQLTGYSHSSEYYLQPLKRNQKVLDFA